MHQQIRGSPDSIAGNIARIVNVLAAAGVNILGIAPDFDAPHVRVIVGDEAGEEEGEAFEMALDAMAKAGLAPQIRPAVLLSMPNSPTALQSAIDRLTRKGYAIESILVLPGEPEPGKAWVSLGVAQTIKPDWDTDSNALSSEINDEIEGT
jgi:hypothetical protein